MIKLAPSRDGAGLFSVAQAWALLADSNEEEAPEEAPYSTGGTQFLPVDNSDYEEEYRTRPSIGF